MRLAAFALLLAGCCGLSAPAGDDGRARQLLVITIDTEALRSRADTDRVQKLIWGDFGHGRRTGIDEMMDAANAAGVPLSFFVDVLEERTYPGELRDVAEHIAARGHDVEVHTHPEQMPDEFWTDIGVSNRAPETFTRDEARAFLDETRRITADWAIPAPRSYRAGGFRYSAGLVEALPDDGYTVDYDYNIQGETQVDHDIGLLPVFRWENDLPEVPISYIDHCGTNDRFDDFTWLDEGQDVAYDDIRRFQDATPGNVLVLMMHSWSLLTLDDATRHYEWGGDEKLQAFAAFLAGLPDFVEVVSAQELADRIARGDVEIDATEETADLF
jgi:hypothetical protein